MKKSLARRLWRAETGFESMMKHNATHMFHFSFEKDSSDIIEACRNKLAGIEQKMEEREERIVKVRKEYKISDVALIDILEQARKSGNNPAMSYSTSSNVQAQGSDSPETITVGAGVVNLLMTERDLINSEKEQATRLGLIIRNLKNGKDDHGEPCGVRLSYEELEYLGF